MKDTLIDGAVRKIPDFPKKGILFYDITGLLINPEAFHYCLDKLTGFYKDEKIDAVAAIESRGFIFAAPFADRLGIPLILIRKKGKLPGETYSCSYDLEYNDRSSHLRYTKRPADIVARRFDCNRRHAECGAENAESGRRRGGWFLRRYRIAVFAL